MEGVEWSFQDFVDNRPCLDLIEGRISIFSLMNEVFKRLFISLPNCTLGVMIFMPSLSLMFLLVRHERLLQFLALIRSQTFLPRGILASRFQYHLGWQNSPTLGGHKMCNFFTRNLKLQNLVFERVNFLTVQKQFSPHGHFRGENIRKFAQISAA